MSRGFIHQVHIADGFADDCEELIHCCLKADTLNYEIFCEIWKEMKFSFLYHGRKCGAEIIELSEELIHIAKHYMVVDTSNFEESVAGLFLVYALVNLQPYKRFASLRLVPEDVDAIHRIETLARRQKRYDVLYILGSLLTEGPVQYHAAARERGMESSIRKYLEGYTGIDRLGVRPRGVFHRQNEELDLLRELASITRRYALAKEAVGGVNNRNLNYTSATFPSELDASLKKVINGIVDTNDGDEPNEREKTTTMQSVREKAMRQTVDGVRHLRSAANKTLSPEKPSSRAECEIKQKPGKVKQLSPKKPVTSLAKRKSGKVLPKRKRKRKPLNRSDDETSTEESVHSDGEKTTDDDEQDLNLESFSKEANTENEVAEETVLNIAIDSLPVFIREERDGKMFEIEIIDNLKTNVKDEQVVNAKKMKKLEEATMKKCDSREGTSSLAKQSLQPVELKDTVKTKHTAKKTKDTIKKTKDTVKTKDKIKTEDTVKTKDTVKNEGQANTKVLKRLDKRDLKKPLLKSKFKRLGMLNAANFKEPGKSDTAEDSPKEKK